MGYTKVHENRDDIKQMHEQLTQILGHQYSEQLTELNTSMETLFVSNDDGFRKDENGDFPEFTQENLDNIKQKYNASAIAAGKIRRSILSDTSLSTAARSKALEQIAKMQEYISSDMYDLSKAQPGENLYDSMEKATSPLAKVDSEELGRAGGNLSSRIPVTIQGADGKEVKGFFTPDSTFDPAATYDEKLQELEVKYGKDASSYKKLIRSARTKADDFAKNRMYYAPDPETRNYYANFRATDSSVLGFIMTKSVDDDGYLQPGLLLGAMKQILGEKDTPSVSRKFIDQINDIEANDSTLEGKNYTNAEKAFFDYYKTLKSLSFQTTIYNDILGIKPGENIDKRNTAMSIVASMLKVPNLIVEARPLGMVVNGKEVTGTFMPNAEGMDVHNPTEEDKTRSASAISSNNGKGLKDLADLQALDYICGNYDRHSGNMLYKFDDQGHFCGIQGIDNDASFGTNVPSELEGIGRVPPLNGFEYISESMRNTIMDMKPELLSTALHSQGLSSASIDASCSRLERLKMHILRSEQLTIADQEAMAKGLFRPIKVMNDEAFNKLTVSDCVDKYTKGLNTANYFIYPAIVIEEASLSGKVHKDFVQPLAKEVKAENAKTLKDNASDFQQQLKNLKKVDSWFVPSSKEFKNMRAALEGLASFSETIKNPPMKLENAKKFAEQMNVLENWTKDYITKKGEELDKSEYADSRLRFARGLKKFVTGKKMEFADRIVKELNTKKVKNKEPELAPDSAKKQKNQQPALI